MSKALYRKYRPTSLSEIVGQSPIVSSLENSLKSEKISHAYLFTGPRGTGKTSIARIFAHEINHFSYNIEDEYLDIIEIDAASNTGVDNIRELREKATIAPTKGKYKIYIIDEVHMLSKSAFNALLKTLEEPPEHVIFIMATTDFDKVPVTIVSRAQVYNFNLADAKTMFDHLKKIVSLEKINITDDALNIIVTRGGGSFRDSLSLLDQISNISTSEITAEVINSALGLPQEEKIKKLLDFYINSDIKNITASLKNLISTPIKPEVIAELCLNEIINNPSPALLPLMEALTGISAPFEEAKLTLAFLKTAPNFSAPMPLVAPPSETPKKSYSEEFKTSSEPKQSSPQVSETRHEVSETSPQVPENSGDFSWNNFLEQIRAESSGLYNYLNKVSYEIKNDTLHIYPDSKFTKIFLERPSNTSIITPHLGTLALSIHNFGEKTNGDATISQISDIMGGIQEVKTNGGEIPF